MQQAGEPSVEEILESIKKVIARETAPGQPGAATAQRRRSPIVEPVEPAAEEEAAEILELDEAAMLALSDQDEGIDPNNDDTPLTGEDTANAMRDNFAALAMLSQPGRQPQIVRSGETSLEGLTRDLLRPMLARWIDENLPGMVEGLVKAEIARIAGKKR